jgi:hypothetical protein
MAMHSLAVLMSVLVCSTFAEKSGSSYSSYVTAVDFFQVRMS